MKEFKNGDAIFQITKEHDADVMQNFRIKQTGGFNH